MSGFANAKQTLTNKKTSLSMNNEYIVLKYNIGRQVVFILLASTIIPSLLWGLSLYADIGDWQRDAWWMLALGVVSAIAAIWHSSRTSHRFVLRSDGISIDYELFEWRHIEEARLTQKGRELPTLTLHLASEKVAYLVQLNETQYAILLETLKVRLGDNFKIHPRAREATYPQVNTNIYHDPN